MKDLIEAYWRHTESYLLELEILSIDNALCEYTNEPCYNVTIKNPSLRNGEEIVQVKVSELLEFMWSKVK